MLLRMYTVNSSVLFSSLEYSKVSEIKREVKYNKPYRLLNLGFMIFENFPLARLLGAFLFFSPKHVTFQQRVT